MLLKAIALNGSAVNFKLEDCPVCVSEGIIALINKKNSYLLYENTIVRGDGELGIYEGDRVLFDNKDAGKIIYSGGFKIQGLDGSLKNFVRSEHIKVLRGKEIDIHEVTKCSERTPMLYKYNDKEFNIATFIFPLEKGCIAVSGNSYEGTYVYVNEIKLFTGKVDENGKNLFFGDFYNGGIITLVKGMPMIKTRNGNITI